MGPRVGGLSHAGTTPEPRWRGQFERAWGVTIAAPRRPADRALARFLDEWDSGLARIDFPEVTNEDRVTFLEQVVSWQVRRALAAGRFDLAHAIRARLTASRASRT